MSIIKIYLFSFFIFLTMQGGHTSFIPHDIQGHRDVLTHIHKPEERFYNYGISKLNNNCAFHALLQKTNQNIRDRVLEKIKTKAEKDYNKNTNSRTLKYLRSAIRNESDRDLARILKIETWEAKDIKTKKSSDFNWMDYGSYLTYYQTTTEMIQFTEEYDSDGNRLNIPNRCTLLDLMALVYHTSFKVFKRDENPHFIRLAHELSMKDPMGNRIPHIHLLYDQLHYTLLLPLTTSDEGHTLAQTYENIYFQRDEQHAQEELAQTRQYLERHAQDILPLSPIENIQSNLFPLLGREEEVDQTPPLPITHSTEEITSRPSSRRLLNLQSVIKFIDHRTVSLQTEEGDTLRGPRAKRAAYNFIKSLKPSNVHEKIEQQLILARLLLEHHVTPINVSSSDYTQTLLTALSKIVDDYAQSQDGQLKRYANYARLFKGRCHMRLGQYHEAYNTFKSIGKNYTKSYYIDIAEMIIDHDFIPPDHAHDFMDYAKSLLETHTSSSSTSRASSKKTAFKLGDAAKPAFRNRKNSRHKTRLLQEKISNTHTSSTSRRQRDGSTRSLSRHSHDTHLSESFIESQNRTQVSDRSSLSRRHHGSDHSPHATIANEAVQTLGHKRLLESRQEPARKISRNTSVSPSSLDSSDSTSNSDTESGSSPSTSSSDDHILSPSQVSQRFLDFENLEDTVGDKVKKLLMKAKYALKYRKGQEKVNHFLLKAMAYAKEHQREDLYPSIYIRLGHARHTGDEHTSNSYWYLRAFHLLGEHSDVTLRAQALIGLGHTRHTDDEHRHDTDWYLDAIDLLSEHGDVTLRAQALIGLGNARHTDDHHRHNADWYLDAIDLLGKHGDVALRAQALIGLGHAHHTDDEHTSNSYWYLDAIDLLGKHDDVNLRAQALIGLGNTRYTDHHHRYDANWYLDALRLLGEHGDVNLRAQALIGLGNARYTDHHHRHDANWYLEAFHLLGEHGDVTLRVQALIGLGHARHITRDYQQKDWYLEAFHLLGEHGDVALRAQALIGLGNARYTDDEHTREQWYLNAIDLLVEHGDVNLRAQALIGLGNARHIDDHHRHNADWYLDAIDLLGEHGDVTLKAQALIGLGNFYSSKRQNREALRYFQDAHRIAPTRELKSKAQHGINRVRRYLN